MITGRLSRVPSSRTTSLVPSSAHRRIARFKKFISFLLLSGAACPRVVGDPDSRVAGDGVHRANAPFISGLIG